MEPREQRYHDVEYDADSNQEISEMDSIDDEELVEPHKPRDNDVESDVDFNQDVSEIEKIWYWWRWKKW